MGKRRWPKEGVYWVKILCQHPCDNGSLSKIPPPCKTKKTHTQTHTHIRNVVNQVHGALKKPGSYLNVRYCTYVIYKKKLRVHPQRFWSYANNKRKSSGFPGLICYNGNQACQICANCLLHVLRTLLFLTTCTPRPFMLQLLTHLLMHFNPCYRSFISRLSPAPYIA